MMKKYLLKLSPGIKSIIAAAASTADKNSMPVYLVGGFVRDLLLGIKNLDVDIVVEGDGIKFAEALAVLFKANVIRHRNFGTATILVTPGIKVDIVTARREIYPERAHLPQVAPGTLADDLARRDFTINALAIDISDDNFGRIIDVSCGIEDIKNRRIRVLHDNSFTDDPTRILRAIRFEQRLGFRIEPETLRLLKAAVKQEMLIRLEPQRLRDDLILMLKEKEPIKQLKRLQALAGFGFLSRSFKPGQAAYRLLSAVDIEINNFTTVYSHRRQPDIWLMYFMALTDSLSLGRLRKICKKLVFRKGEEKRIISFKKISRSFISQLSKPDLKPSKVYGLLEPLSYEAILLIKATYPNKRINLRIADFFKHYNGTRICTNGEDLKRIGIAPGPRYRRIMDALLKAKLDGAVRGKEDEFSLVRKLTGRVQPLAAER